jgi:hypothetical protein
MISLRDSIEILTTPRQLFAWLDRMPQVYTSWHPDHVACRVAHGSILEVGSELECEEFLHGKLHSMSFRTTRVIPEKRVEFEIAGMGRGAFEAEGKGDIVRFVTELEIGLDMLIVGPLLDFIFSLFFNKRIDAMKQHMAEEGRNLKAILESGSPISVGQDGSAGVG